MSDAAPLNLVLMKPPKSLHDFVETIWMLDIGGAYSRTPEWILPSVSAEIVINRTSDTVCVGPLDGEIAELHGPLVIAPRDRPFAMHQGRDERILGVHLKPGALFALTGVPTSHLKNGFIGLADVLELRTVPDELYPPFAVRDAIDTLAALFRNRLSGGNAETIARSLMNSAPSVRSVGDLSKSLNASYYKLNRVSSDRLGFTPKKFLRLRRFERSLRALGRSPHSLVEIALGNGYYDQAHFHNDFVEFSGITPTQYRRAASYDPYHLPAAL